ncbi:MAG: HPr(Ser) kinase/phosphatase [Deltaproteobacteria bacterium]|nr:HPr(Ser) kinase/phosphatase [Deltaproteobacteria bacterium]
MGAPVSEVFDQIRIEQFTMRLVSGEKGLSRELATSRIQKPGLLLTGLLEELHSDRLQIFGAAEIGYLTSLSDEKLRLSLSLIERANIPGLIVTRGIEPPGFLVDISRRKDIPLYTTPITSSIFIEGITRHIDELLAPTVTMHGVLVDVLGVGVLITGKSGIGKSECALDLVSRGYRLVSDDVVIIKRLPSAVLMGTSSDLIRYHMEIRGLGIVNIKDIFGITAIRERKQLDIVVELVKWEPADEHDRLGLEEIAYDILGVNLPHMRLPVTPGRSIASIVEVAARNQILKIMGHHPAKAFKAALDSAIKANEKVEN